LKAHTDLLALFKVPPLWPFLSNSVSNACVTIAFAVLLEFVFHALIFPPHHHLGSFGMIHDGLLAWLWRVWEGLRVCWDLIIWAALRNGHEFVRVTVRVGEDIGRVMLQIGEELARVLGARQPVVEADVEDTGSQHGNNTQATSGSSRELEPGPQASHPPPYESYDVGTHYLKCATMLIMTLA
jgi:hypothetical protein